MIFDLHTAKKTAELLLQINAIKLNSKNYFTWASGWKSPIYCDNRIILSFPEVRKFITSEFSKHITTKFGKPDVIAGVATGAIGIGALVADSMNLPFVYVRPEPKKHGRKNQIEGVIEKGQNVVVIEDLISTGGSSLQAVKALQAEGVTVQGMAAIFTYEFETSKKRIKEAELEVYTLSNYTTLLEKAVEKNDITTTELTILKKWRKAPDKL